MTNNLAKNYFYNNKVPLPEKLFRWCAACPVRKLDKLRTKEDVVGLKLYLYCLTVTSLIGKKKSSKDLTWDLRDASSRAVDPSTVY